MSLVLLDTNVISELVRPRPEPRVTAFLEKHADAITSALVLHEITYGAERTRDPALRAKLAVWIASIRMQFANRIIEVDADIAAHAGKLRAAAELKGAIVDPMDALIAASGAARGAAIATRNVKDFAALGVAVIDPWKA